MRLTVFLQASNDKAGLTKLIINTAKIRVGIPKYSVPPSVPITFWDNIRDKLLTNKDRYND